MLRPKASTGGLKKVESKTYPADASSYKLLEEIGTGASAVVYKARCLPLDETVAVKVANVDGAPELLDVFFKEVVNMKSLQHPNLVSLLSSFVVGSDLWLVMPYMEGGSFAHLMQYQFPTGLEEVVVASVVLQVLQALEYLHKQSFIHRDIKSGNLLLSADGTVRLSDLGVSTAMQRKFDWGGAALGRSTIVGSPYWMAPEVFQGSAAYGQPADIWSVGITVIELSCGAPPNSRFSPFKALMMALQGPAPSFEDKTQASKHMRDFVNWCLQKDDKARPTATQLLNHKFLRQAKDHKFLAKTLLGQISNSLGDRVVEIKSQAQLQASPSLRAAEEEGEQEDREEEEGLSVEPSTGVLPVGRQLSRVSNGLGLSRQFYSQDLPDFDAVQSPDGIARVKSISRRASDADSELSTVRSTARSVGQVHGQVQPAGVDTSQEFSTNSVTTGVTAGVVTTVVSAFTIESSIPTITGESPCSHPISAQSSCISVARPSISSHRTIQADSSMNSVQSSQPSTASSMITSFVNSPHWDFPASLLEAAMPTQQSELCAPTLRTFPSKMQRSASFGAMPSLAFRECGEQVSWTICGKDAQQMSQQLSQKMSQQLYLVLKASAKFNFDPQEQDSATELRGASYSDPGDAEHLARHVMASLDETIDGLESLDDMTVPRDSAAEVTSQSTLSFRRFKASFFRRLKKVQEKLGVSSAASRSPGSSPLPQTRNSVPAPHTSGKSSSIATSKSTNCVPSTTSKFRPTLSTTGNSPPVSKRGSAHGSVQATTPSGSCASESKTSYSGTMFKSIKRSSDIGTRHSASGTTSNGGDKTDVK